MDNVPTDNRKRLVIDRSTLRQLVSLGIVTTVVYFLFSYGGVRSPDSEIVFRTAEALATRGTFRLTAELKGWQDFGLPRGKDGGFYSIFGPGQSIAAVPFVELALLINKSGWYKSIPDFIPISHFVGGGVIDYVKGITPADLQPHALRFLVSPFNVVVGSLCVCFFYLLVKLLTRSDFAARWSAIVFAFGSLMMPYSGTFFSEPLATLFVILSLYCLVWNDLTTEAAAREKHLSLLSSGIFLGIATTVHITAVLFAPFFFLYGLYPFLRTRWSVKEFAVSGAIFAAGLGLFLTLLGYYNYIRFGNVFETGRTALQQVEYASFVAPWRGLSGLVFGGGKGIVWYCPAAIISLFLWRPFHKRFTFLSYTILGSVLFRIVFIASRSDWHGGFSLGPRYLVMALPLLMLPYGEILVHWTQRQAVRTLWLFFLATLICIWQQIYFSLGEIFSFFHFVNWTFRDHGINVFANDALYLDWDKSPLLYLLDTKRGPFLLRSISLSNTALCWLFVAMASFLLSLHYVQLLRKHVGRWH
jgi:hypothetical protein